tara:strand:- start:131 stop:553 length:423 start_codon:yes stop_codon:yes gene_type:complete
MNKLILPVIVLVAFIYFGGSNVPNVLKNNKQVFLGLVVGLILPSFMGMRLEGHRMWGLTHTHDDDPDYVEPTPSSSPQIQPLSYQDCLGTGEKEAGGGTGCRGARNRNEITHSEYQECRRCCTPHEPYNNRTTCEKTYFP